MPQMAKPQPPQSQQQKTEGNLQNDKVAGPETEEGVCHQVLGKLL